LRKIYVGIAGWESKKTKQIPLNISVQRNRLGMSQTTVDLATK